MKVNFNEENLQELRELIATLSLEGWRFSAPMGVVYTVCDIIDSVSPTTLHQFSKNLKKMIAELDVEDEWVENGNATRQKQLQQAAQFISLARGWKLAQAEKETQARKTKRERAAAKAQLEQLKKIELSSNSAARQALIKKLEEELAEHEEEGEA